MTFHISSFLIPLAETLYAFCAFLTFLLGINGLILSLLYLRYRKQVWSRVTPQMQGEWPAVTIQLPIYNENALVIRLLESISRLEYPRERMQIQVLDDSTDETSELLQELVHQYQQAGLPIEYYDRPDRQGYKAGNLNHGLEHATGELIAIFDADFDVPADWLLHVVPYFQDPRIGLVQTRFTHRNYRSNLLTRMAAMVLDTQMVVEFSALSGAGMLVNFLGSSGVFRRRCLEEHGGWKVYTLTEDIDMFMDSEINGWKGVYLPHVLSQAELPEQINAYKTQQYRWSRGYAQAYRHFAWKIFKAPWPLLNRLEVVLRFSYIFFFPAILVMLLLVLPVGLRGAPLFIYLSWTMVGAIGPFLMLVLTHSEAFPRFIDRIAVLPAMGVIGIGLSLECGLGVIAGLFKDGGVFRTTPKPGNPGQDGNPWLTRMRRLPLVVGEILLGCYLVLSVYILWPTIGRFFAPWLLISAFGFWVVAAASILEK
jgi:cellulose synthase/poly-beta-1,6-N-acetylglucosamine synthase-like glycosyltransferase